MHPLLQVFIDIAVRKRGPDQLPASGFLLGVAVAAFALTDLIGYALSELPPQQIVTLALLGPMFLGAFAVLVLRIHQHQSRILKTLCALFGVGAMFNLGQLILAIVALTWPESEQVDVAIALAWLALLVVNVSSFGYIFQRAVDRDLVSGAVLSLIYFVTYFSIANAVINA
jgi:drug/metabolite transporter (DMT)-like permease